MDAGEEPGEPGLESNASLMAQFYEGSHEEAEEAFETLSDSWWPRLFAYFRRQGFGVEDAEDLVVEALVKLYATKDGKNFDTTQRLEPFFFTVARNLAIATWRKTPASGTVVSLDADLPLVTAEANFDLSADLQSCIMQLPEAEQTYVMLCGRHGLGELSHTEIAALMGRWSPQITKLSQRALRALQRCMEQKGYR